MYDELLKEVELRMAPGSLQPPCSRERIEKLEQRSIRMLGHAIPFGYGRFLSVADGFIWNGLKIYGSANSHAVRHPNLKIDGFIEANLEYRDLRDGDPMEDYLIFAEDSVTFFVYHIPREVYEVFTIVGMTILETFETFDELLVDAFKGHL